MRANDPERTRCNQRRQFGIAEFQEPSRQSPIDRLVRASIVSLEVVGHRRGPDPPVECRGEKCRHAPLADAYQADARRIDVGALGEAVDRGQRLLHVEARHGAADAVPQPVEDHPPVFVVGCLAVGMVVEPLDRLWQIDDCAPRQQAAKPRRRRVVAAQTGELIGPLGRIRADNNDGMPSIGRRRE